MVGGSLVSGKSKKHKTVTRSSPEVEYQAMAHEHYELLWLRILLDELGLKQGGPRFYIVAIHQ